MSAKEFPTPPPRMASFFEQLTSQRLMLQNEARRVAYFRFEAGPPLVRAAGL